MLDFIKHLPLEWRQRDNACTPRGPQSLGRKPLNYRVGGSSLSFHAPRYSPDIRHSESFNGMRREDQLSRHPKKYNNGVMANDRWRSISLFKRDWAFWGPWMTGAKAQLTMTVSVIGRDEEHEYKNVSFFHPRVFESVLVDFLNASYSHDGIEAGFPRRGPLDWKPLTNFPVFGAGCKIFQHDPYDGEIFSPDELILFPITLKHFVKIRFLRHNYSTDKNMTPYFDTTPINELQQAITNTIQLELGPEAQAEWNRVAAECPDMSLSDEFAPLQWPMDPSQQVSAVDGTPESEAEKLPKQKEAAG